MNVREMLTAHPQGPTLDAGLLQRAIEALVACSQTCAACADACLAEEDVASMRRCIRLDQDCADVCATTARMLSRQTAMDSEVVRAMLQACVTVCRANAAECGEHAEHHDHCRICSEACEACAAACQEVLQAL